MKKLAAGVGVVALVVAAQFAFAQDNAKNTNAPGAADSAMTVTGTDACAGWTKGGGASVGKPNPGRTAADSSSSMDASTAAACEAAASSSSSASAVQYSAKQGKTGATK